MKLTEDQVREIAERNKARKGKLEPYPPTIMRDVERLVAHIEELESDLTANAHALAIQTDAARMAETDLAAVTRERDDAVAVCMRAREYIESRNTEWQGIAEHVNTVVSALSAVIDKEGS